MSTLPFMNTVERRQPLPPAVLSGLSGISVVRELSAGTVLYRHGDTASEMFIVEDGTVEVLLDESGPARVLGPGALFGEIALLTPGGKRTAIVIAATDCRLRVVERQRFEEFLSEEPTLARATLQHACTYLIESENQLVQDLRRRNAELEAALDHLRRTREELTETEVRADTDVLTGLYNRRCLNHQLPKFIHRAQAMGEGLAVFMFDLDHFKPINDQHGHGAGDAVLKGVGAIIKGAVRSCDLPCRIGGDEFAVLVAPLETSSSDDDVVAMAVRIRTLIASHVFRVSGLALRVGVTVGGTAWRAGDNPSSILGRADEHLYEAKNAGRNRVGFDGRIIE